MRKFLTVSFLSAGILFSLVLAVQASAADKQGRLSGTVLGVDLKSSEIMIRQGETAHRVVLFTDATKFVTGSPSDSKTAEPSSADKVQAGNYLTCVGTWSDVKLAAISCTIRSSKR